MATISGRVIFDRDRSATISPVDTGIFGVSVVLQNIETNQRLVVYTDMNGDYSFVNVPNGNYRIVESYGIAQAIPSPGNFELATIGSIPIGNDPPISIINNPPVGATDLDSLTPNTLLVTVSGANLLNQIFLDGAIRNIPIQTILDTCASISEENLITAADNGTFGFFPAGTTANTGVPEEPYPEVTPDYTYVLPNPDEYTPFGGEYTVQNIMNNALSQQIGAWWRIADHTTGDETGRMMVVNGFEPGSIFFTTAVSVTPNTNYLFSSWILNLFRVTGYANPELGVVILDEEGNSIYSATLGAQIPVNTIVPEWKEIGTVINSQDNTTLTVQFLSEAPEAIGNDYVIDDISLREIEVPIFTLEKVGSTTVASVGDIVTYTVTLENTCSSPLTNVFFRDIVPTGFVFIPDTVTINGVQYQGVDPNVGFSVPNILGEEIAIITFDVIAEFVPNPNPTINTAIITYSYSPVEGGIENEYTVESNEYAIDIVASVDLAVTKTANTNPISIGETIIYTITIVNNGPSNAEDVIVNDVISADILNPEFSLNGGITWNSWTGEYTIGTLENGEEVIILIRGTIANSASGTIVNTATVGSTTPDPNPDNNTDTVITTIKGENQADLSISKSAMPNPVLPGGILTYTLEVTDLGPNNAQNVIVTDNIPTNILNPEFSLDGGNTWNPWTGSYNIGSLANSESITILIRGTVSNSASGTITNTAIVTSSTPDPNLNNNTDTVIITVESQEELADLSISKSAIPNPVLPGGILAYTIEVTNLGPDVAQNVIVTDNIPANILNPEISLDEGITWNPWTGFYNIGSLANGESITILIRGTVSNSASGTITNTATVTSTTPDPDLCNNTSSVIITIQSDSGMADLEIIKRSTSNLVKKRKLLTYIITVTNHGPSSAENVIVLDDVLTSIKNPEFSLDGGITWKSWTGSYNIGSLANGESKIILIRGKVSFCAKCKIVNVALVTSTTQDPNPNNNVSISKVKVYSCFDNCCC